MDKLDVVIKKIDEFNADDPNKAALENFEFPQELLYAKRLSDWVKRLEGDPSEALQIAARGQHIGRWTIPRSQYAMDRAGYLQWRSDLKIFHAKKVKELMVESGYQGKILEDVEKIILKNNLKDNPDSQSIEDALCLVFFENQFEELMNKTEKEKMILILKKSWKKMSLKGQKAALDLKLSAKARDLLVEALG